MTKPREFKLRLDTLIVNNLNQSQQDYLHHTHEIIHVVEYSALQLANERIDSLRRSLDAARFEFVTITVGFGKGNAHGDYAELCCQSIEKALVDDALKGEK